MNNLSKALILMLTLVLMTGCSLFNNEDVTEEPETSQETQEETIDAVQPEEGDPAMDADGNTVETEVDADAEVQLGY